MLQLFCIICYSCLLLSCQASWPALDTLSAARDRGADNQTALAGRLAGSRLPLFLSLFPLCLCLCLSLSLSLFLSLSLSL